MKRNLTISAGSSVTCNKIVCTSGWVELTLQPGASINIGGIAVQNYSNVLDLVFDLTDIIVKPTPCKPLDWNHDHDDHDGSAPLMGVGEMSLIEAF